MKKRYLIYFIFLILIFTSLFNSFTVKSIETFTEKDFFLIENSKEWLTYGFENKDLPIYNSEDLTTFYLPIVIKKSLILNLKLSDLSHSFLYKNSAFTDRFRSMTYKIIESENYYAIIFNMIVYASNKTFNIDIIPKIKNIAINKYAWWNSSWNYYRVLTLSNKLLNAPVKLCVGNSSGLPVNLSGHVAQGNYFKDARFLNIANTTEYYFYMENQTLNDYYVMWIKNSDNASQILLYYNNPNCINSTYRNGNMTFSFFDNFTGTSLNPFWNDKSGTITVSDGVCVLSAVAKMRSTSFSSTNCIIHFKVKASSSAVTKYEGLSNSAVSTTFYNDDWLLFQFDATSNDFYYSNGNEKSETSTKGTDYSADTYYILESRLKQGATPTVYYYRNGILSATHTTNIPNENLNPRFQGANTGVTTVTLDYVFAFTYTTQYISDYGIEIKKPSPFIIFHQNITWSIYLYCNQKFDYTIECNNSQSISDTNVGNGTYSLNLSDLTFECIYIIYVNMTSYGNFSNRTYLYSLNITFFDVSNFYTKNESNNTFLSAIFNIENGLFFSLLCLGLWLFFVREYFGANTDKIKFMCALTQFGIALPTSIILASITLEYVFGYIIIFLIPIFSLYLLVDALLYRSR